MPKGSGIETLKKIPASTDVGSLKSFFVSIKFYYKWYISQFSIPTVVVAQVLKWQ